ncbi:bifunctional WD40 repeat/NLE/WD40-YVTN repeat-like-containing domain superfamily/WD40-repeat-containing domain superfamily [Babesia duncani]|uniref:Bifunctional WD40 repeat/NLE/WD40-YVTN repeat-like-containing domain superfamily/WD40-repeat-containing domain superfamily n=1 Tax=Babesia duncani TaxID=323732 RepID=A0AAD9PK48_9APIC|nr:bifunctional WD40 repeat/NLE/WD40-YVTN repeat-like-containing domain superfamily/WD40-repeat-containing domain superfamily [Babesia duncani]
MEVDQVHADFQNGTLKQYNLPDSTYLIPTTMDAKAISKMINGILELSEPIEFDIYLNGERLVTSISECLEERKINSENALKIIYTLALQEPKQQDVDNLNSWIPSISYSAVDSIVGVCSYDGGAFLYKCPQMTKAFNFKTHGKSASSICLFAKGNIDSGVLQVVSGQVNGSLECYKVNIKQQRESLIYKDDSAHTDTISTIAIDEEGAFIVTGGFDNAVVIYDNTEILQDVYQNDDKIESGKRRLEKVNKIKALCKLTHHTKTVTAITCFDVSNNISNVCTGHDTGSVCIWDLRGPNDSALEFKSAIKDCNLRNSAWTSIFNRMTSCISWNPNRDHLVACTSMGGSVIFLDPRSPRSPLSRVRLEYENCPDRITSCCWSSEIDLMITTASVAMASFMDDSIGDVEEYELNEAIRRSIEDLCVVSFPSI